MMSEENIPPDAGDEKISLDTTDKNARESIDNNNTKQADSPIEAREIGGPKGPEPTRYGDWEQNGRCTDF